MGGKGRVSYAMASKFNYIVSVEILTILGVQRRPLSVKVFLKFEAFCLEMWLYSY